MKTLFCLCVVAAVLVLFATEVQAGVSSDEKIEKLEDIKYKTRPRLMGEKARKVVEDFSKDPNTLLSPSGFHYQLIGATKDTSSFSAIKDVGRVSFSIKVEDMDGKTIVEMPNARTHLRRKTSAFQLLAKIILESKQEGSIKVLLTPEHLHGKQAVDLRKSLGNPDLPNDAPIFVTLTINEAKRIVRDL